MDPACENSQLYFRKKRPSRLIIMEDDKSVSTENVQISVRHCARVHRRTRVCPTELLKISVNRSENDEIALVNGDDSALQHFAQQIKPNHQIGLTISWDILPTCVTSENVQRFMKVKRKIETISVKENELSQMIRPVPNEQTESIASRIDAFAPENDVVPHSNVVFGANTSSQQFPDVADSSVNNLSTNDDVIKDVSNSLAQPAVNVEILQKETTDLLNITSTENLLEQANPLRPNENVSLAPNDLDSEASNTFHRPELDWPTSAADSLRDPAAVLSELQLSKQTEESNAVDPALLSHTVVRTDMFEAIESDTVQIISQPLQKNDLLQVHDQGLENVSIDFPSAVVSAHEIVVDNVSSLDQPDVFEMARCSAEEQMSLTFSNLNDFAQSLAPHIDEEAADVLAVENDKDLVRGSSENELHVLTATVAPGKLNDSNKNVTNIAEEIDTELSLQNIYDNKNIHDANVEENVNKTIPELDSVQNLCKVEHDYSLVVEQLDADLPVETVDVVIGLLNNELASETEITDEFQHRVSAADSVLCRTSEASSAEISVETVNEDADTNFERSDSQADFGIVVKAELCNSVRISREVSHSDEALELGLNAENFEDSADVLVHENAVDSIAITHDFHQNSLPAVDYVLCHAIQSLDPNVAEENVEAIDDFFKDALPTDPMTVADDSVHVSCVKVKSRNYSHTSEVITTCPALESSDKFNKQFDVEVPIESLTIVDQLVCDGSLSKNYSVDIRDDVLSSTISATSQQNAETLPNDNVSDIYNSEDGVCVNDKLENLPEESRLSLDNEPPVESMIASEPDQDINDSITKSETIDSQMSISTYSSASTDDKIRKRPNSKDSSEEIQLRDVVTETGMDQDKVRILVPEDEIDEFSERVDEDQILCEHLQEELHEFLEQSLPGKVLLPPDIGLPPGETASLVEESPPVMSATTDELLSPNLPESADVPSLIQKNASNTNSNESFLSSAGNLVKVSLNVEQPVEIQTMESGIDNSVMNISEKRVVVAFDSNDETHSLHMSLETGTEFNFTTREQSTDSLLPTTTSDSTNDVDQSTEGALENKVDEQCLPEVSLQDQEAYGNLQQQIGVLPESMLHHSVNKLSEIHQAVEISAELYSATMQDNVVGTLKDSVMDDVLFRKGSECPDHEFNGQHDIEKSTVYCEPGQITDGLRPVDIAARELPVSDEQVTDSDLDDKSLLACSVATRETIAVENEDRTTAGEMQERIAILTLDSSDSSSSKIASDDIMPTSGARVDGMPSDELTVSPFGKAVDDTYDENKQQRRAETENLHLSKDLDSLKVTDLDKVEEEDFRGTAGRICIDVGTNEDASDSVLPVATPAAMKDGSDVSQPIVEDVPNDRQLSNLMTQASELETWLNHMQAVCLSPDSAVSEKQAINYEEIMTAVGEKEVDIHDAIRQSIELSESDPQTCNDIYTQLTSLLSRAASFKDNLDNRLSTENRRKAAIDDLASALSTDSTESIIFGKSVNLPDSSELHDSSLEQIEFQEASDLLVSRLSKSLDESADPGVLSGEMLSMKVLESSTPLEPGEMLASTLSEPLESLSSPLVGPGEVFPSTQQDLDELLASTTPQIAQPPESMKLPEANEFVSNEELTSMPESSDSLIPSTLCQPCELLSLDKSVSLQDSTTRAFNLEDIALQDTSDLKASRPLASLEDHESGFVSDYLLSAQLQESSILQEPCEILASTVSKPGELLASVLSKQEDLFASTLSEPCETLTSTLSEPDELLALEVSKQSEILASVQSEPSELFTSELSKPSKIIPSAVSEPYELSASQLLEPGGLLASKLSKQGEVLPSGLSRQGELLALEMSEFSEQLVSTPSEQVELLSSKLPRSDEILANTLSATSQPVASTLSGSPTVQLPEYVRQQNSSELSLASNQPTAMLDSTALSFIKLPQSSKLSSAQQSDSESDQSQILEPNEFTATSDTVSEIRSTTHEESTEYRISMILPRSSELMEFTLLQESSESLNKLPSELGSEYVECMPAEQQHISREKLTDVPKGSKETSSLLADEVFAGKLKEFSNSSAMSLQESASKLHVDTLGPMPHSDQLESAALRPLSAILHTVEQDLFGAVPAKEGELFPKYLSAQNELPLFALEERSEIQSAKIAESDQYLDMPGHENCEAMKSGEASGFHQNSAGAETFQPSISIADDVELANKITADIEKLAHKRICWIAEIQDVVHVITDNLSVSEQNYAALDLSDVTPLSECIKSVEKLEAGCEDALQRINLLKKDVEAKQVNDKDKSIVEVLSELQFVEERWMTLDRKVKAQKAELFDACECEVQYEAELKNYGAFLKTAEDKLNKLEKIDTHDITELEQQLMHNKVLCQELETQARTLEDFSRKIKPNSKQHSKEAAEHLQKLSADNKDKAEEQGHELEKLHELWADVEKQLQEKEKRIAQLRGDINSLHLVPSDSIVTMQDKLNSLRALEELLDGEQSSIDATVHQRKSVLKTVNCPQLEQKEQNLNQSLLSCYSDMLTDCKKLEDLIFQKKFDDLANGLESNLADIKKKVAEIEQLLQDGDVDNAEELMHSVKVECDKAQALQEKLHSCADEICLLNSPGTPFKTRLEKIDENLLDVTTNNHDLVHRIEKAKHEHLPSSQAIRQMTAWLSVQKTLLNNEAEKESPQSCDDVRNLINAMNIIKRDVDSHQPMINYVLQSTSEQRSSLDESASAESAAQINDKYQMLLAEVGDRILALEALEKKWADYDTRTSSLFDWCDAQSSQLLHQIDASDWVDGAIKLCTESRELIANKKNELELVRQLCSQLASDPLRPDSSCPPCVGEDLRKLQTRLNDLNQQVNEKEAELIDMRKAEVQYEAARKQLKEYLQSAQEKLNWDLHCTANLEEIQQQLEEKKRFFEELPNLVSRFDELSSHIHHGTKQSNLASDELLRNLANSTQDKAADHEQYLQNLCDRLINVEQQLDQQTLHMKEIKDGRMSYQPDSNDSLTTLQEKLSKACAVQDLLDADKILADATVAECREILNCVHSPQLEKKLKNLEQSYADNKNGTITDVMKLEELAKLKQFETDTASLQAKLDAVNDRVGQIERLLQSELGDENVNRAEELLITVKVECRAAKELSENLHKLADDVLLLNSSHSALRDRLQPLDNDLLRLIDNNYDLNQRVENAKDELLPSTQAIRELLVWLSSTKDLLDVELKEPSPQKQEDVTLRLDAISAIKVDVDDHEPLVNFVVQSTLEQGSDVDRHEIASAESAAKINNKYQIIANEVRDRIATLKSLWQKWADYDDRTKCLNSWCDNQESLIPQLQQQIAGVDAVKAVKHCKASREEIGEKKKDLELVRQLGLQLLSDPVRPDSVCPPCVEESLIKLQKRLNDLDQQLAGVQLSAEEKLKTRSDFDVALQNIDEILSFSLKEFNKCNKSGAATTAEQLTKLEEIATKLSDQDCALVELTSASERLKTLSDLLSCQPIDAQVEKIKNRCTDLRNDINAKQKQLEDNLNKISKQLQADLVSKSLGLQDTQPGGQSNADQAEGQPKKQLLIGISNLDQPLHSRTGSDSQPSNLLDSKTHPDSLLGNSIDPNLCIDCQPSNLFESQTLPARSGEQNKAEENISADSLQKEQEVITKKTRIRFSHEEPDYAVILASLRDLEIWVTSGETLLDSFTVPPDELNVIEQRIEEHKNLVTGLAEWKPKLGDIRTVTSHMIQLTAMTENLSDRISSATSRWEAINRRSDEWKNKLTKSLQKEMPPYMDALAVWIDDTRTDVMKMKNDHGNGEQILNAAELEKLYNKLSAIAYDGLEIQEVLNQLQEISDYALFGVDISDDTDIDQDRPSEMSAECASLIQLCDDLQKMLESQAGTSFRPTTEISGTENNPNLSTTSNWSGSSEGLLKQVRFGFRRWPRNLNSNPRRNVAESGDDVTMNKTEPDTRLSRFSRACGDAAPVQALMIALVGAASVVPVCDTNCFTSVISQLSLP